MKLAHHQKHDRRQRAAGETAFTMVEIAISLAIIGFALVAIIGVLPFGMNVQRENREETIINQDAAYWIEAIRNGARGLDELTNAVIGITNYAAEYSSTNSNPTYYTYGYTYLTPFYPLTNGYNIIGLLSTPKYEPAQFIVGGTRSNHIVLYTRSLSGLAVEKYPQDNPDVRQDAFSYRMLVENVPVSLSNAGTPAGQQLAGNLHELRLYFRWPLLNGGNIGNGRQTFRTMVGGTVANDPPGGVTWFFQPDTFAYATNAP